MAKTFREWQVDQLWLFPPSVKDLVPEGHLAHFVRETVRESLDLSAILDTYSEERGYPPYHPTMMTALLLYAYSQGVYSSRRIARGCEERVDFMAVTALSKPDFRTIAEFRKRHLAALSSLFVQVLDLCRRAGLVKLGHVALDGTKIRANASKHKAMSYGRMKKAEVELADEVSRWFSKAEQVDASEDASLGADRRGDELPEWVRHKAQRLEKIRAAKAALEAEAKPASAPRDDDSERRGGGGGGGGGGEPAAKAQRNFTDPESRILKTPGGFEQAYNAQAAVDAASQVIVARGLTNEQNDVPQLPAMLRQIRANTGRQAREVSADSGYRSEENFRELERRHVRGYIATGRQKHGASAAIDARRDPRGPRTRAMEQRLRRGGFRSRYRLRKRTVEPVFGLIKYARGFRQFLLRGLQKVRAEWSLICTAHNLLKLAAASR